VGLLLLDVRVLQEFPAMVRKFSGPSLRAARLRAGLKAERLALLIDRSVYAVHQYESGRCAPTAAVLGELSIALSTTIDSFFVDDEAVSVDAA
jgi:transcriptional regulator with XRE-family HTH domain